MIAPVFAQLAQRHPNVLFIKVDVDEAQVRPHCLSPCILHTTAISLP